VTIEIITKGIIAEITKHPRFTLKVSRVF